MQGQPQMSPADANRAIRNAVVGQALDMWQNTYATTVTTGIPSAINIPLRAVGLNKRIFIELVATVTAGAQSLTLQNLGPSCFFNPILFNDLSNQQRINTPSWHLNAVASLKRKRVFGAAYTTDTPNGYGNVISKTMVAPATITNGTAGTVYAYFEVPLSYSDFDLRGAIYANVTNATLYLGLTVNPALLQVTGVDPTQSMYQSAGAAAGVLTSYTVNVYQNYLDQLPLWQSGPNQGRAMLPMLDIGTAYLLNYSPLGGLVANLDNPQPYANFREFQSTTLYYDNSGVVNAGTDISYFALQSANYTNIFKVDPPTNTMMTRMILGDDMPKGMYYFDHRHKPISTIQYGNMALVVNPLTVTGAGSSLIYGYESLALINLITGAGALSGT
jgi:hypothetical protein